MWQSLGWQSEDTVPAASSPRGVVTTIYMSVGLAAPRREDASDTVL